MINIKKFAAFTIVAVAVFAFANSTSATVSPSSPSHGWNDQSIRLDYSSGPNIKVLQDTGITITRLYSESYNAFGYFTYNPYTYQITDIQEVSFADGDSVFIGDFDAGTNIGTWLTTDYGTSYSLNALNPYGSTRATYLGDTADGNMVIGLEGDRLWSGTDYREMVVAIEPDTHAPAGQPLPGILISTLLGAGVVGLIRSRKLRK